VTGFDERAEDLFENAPCGYLSAAPDGTLLRVNATFLEWTGYRREELLGVKRFQDLLSVGGRIYHETHYAPMLRLQGSVREIAVDIVGANGDRLPVLVNSVLVRDAEGTPELVRTTVFDATERKRYERELLTARNRERAARERIERLQRITAALAVAPDPTTIAAVVSDELMAAFAPAGIVVEVRDPASDELDVVASHGVVTDDAKDVTLGAAGLLRLAFDGPRDLEPDERDFLTAVAGQTGLALERARLHQRTADVAVALQRSLLAGDPPVDPRFEVETLYHPAVEDLEVGGDWYDAFRLPDGRVGIVVGDVVGRGLLAATAMGQPRSAVRALAGAGLEPAAVLGHLDTFVEQVSAARYATLAYAAVDPDTGEVRLASAGHLPPVILGVEPHLYMEGRSAPLGVPPSSLPRPEASFALPLGGGFLLYTDGLVERRGEPIDVGLERLLAAIRSTSPQDLVRTLPEALAEQGAADDDVCLLSFRRPRVPKPDE
jgi:PAS domain S-box-containing protein